MTELMIIFTIGFALGCLCGAIFATFLSVRHINKLCEELEQARMNDHRDEQGRFVSHKK